MCLLVDRQPQVEFWVRNLVKRDGTSFFLQTSHDKFYPDFVCKLTDGRVVVIEYKGADRWVGAEEKRMVGSLWAELSGGSCGFVMATEKNWAPIEAIFLQ